jgi:hypothetical protein
VKVSPSKIKVFGDCANQFKYQYVLELPGQQYGALTVLGTVFHYAAEVYELYDNDIDLAVQTFRYYWNHSDELGQKIDWYPPRTSPLGRVANWSAPKSGSKSRSGPIRFEGLSTSSSTGPRNES